MFHCTTCASTIDGKNGSTDRITYLIGFVKWMAERWIKRDGKRLNIEYNNKDQEVVESHSPRQLKSARRMKEEYLLICRHIENILMSLFCWTNARMHRYAFRKSIIHLPNPALYACVHLSILHDIFDIYICHLKWIGELKKCTNRKTKQSDGDTKFTEAKN